MTTPMIDQSKDYARAVAAIVAAMPPERAAQIYDFARFLQARSSGPTPAETDDDWLNDSEEQMQAEDAVWAEVYARHEAKYLALREAAQTEIATGVTQEIFDDSGELAL